MITIDGRATEFMDGDAVDGAAVAVNLDVRARWDGVVTPPEPGEPPAGDPIDGGGARPPRPSSATPLPRPQHGSVFSARAVTLTASATTGSDGRYRLEIDADAAFAELATADDLPRPPDAVEAFVTVELRHLGLGRRILARSIGNGATLRDVDASFDYGKTIVGHTTAREATLWFWRHGEVPAGDRHTVRLRAAGGVEWRSLEIALDRTRAYTGAAVADGLAAATAYEYEVLAGERRLARGTFRTAVTDPAATFRFGFGSCHAPTTDASLDRWRALADRDDLELLLLMGDQIYESDLERLGREWLTRYQLRYHAYWAHRPMREVLRRIPTYMMWDDHEIMDDWGAHHLDRDTPDVALRERFAAAEAAYYTFQQAHNPGGVNAAHKHYSFRRGTTAFFVMDHRSAKGTDPRYPILGAQQWQDLVRWAQSPEAQGADVIVFVSPVPIAFLDIAELKRLARDAAEDAGLGAGAVVGGLIGGVIGGLVAGPAGAAAGAYIGATAGGAAGAELGEHISLDDLWTKFDADDHWTEPNNYPDTERVLGLLFDLANDTVSMPGVAAPGGGVVVTAGRPRRKRAVLVLAGDVHIGAMHFIRSTRREHQANPMIFQACSSGISHEPTGGWQGDYLEDLVRHMREGWTVGDVLAAWGVPDDGPAQFRMGPPRTTTVHDHTGGTTTTTTTADYFEALFAAYLGTRNYGHTAVEKIGAAGERRYRLHVALEGMDGQTIRTSLEYDLDRERVFPITVDPDGPVFQKRRVASSWGPVSRIGARPAAAAPAGVALTHAARTLHLVVAGPTLAHAILGPDGHFGEPRVLAGLHSAVAPALASLDARLHLVHVDAASGRLHHSVHEGGRWSAAALLLYRSHLAPALAAFDHALHLVYVEQGTTTLRHAIFDGHAWSAAQPIADQRTRAAPAIATWGGAVRLVHLGERSDELWSSTFARGRWTTNVLVPQVRTTQAPALTGAPGRLCVATVGTTRAELTEWDGRRWTTPAPIAALATQRTPALWSWNGRLHAVAIGAGGELQLVSSDRATSV